MGGCGWRGGGPGPGSPERLRRRRGLRHRGTASDPQPALPRRAPRRPPPLPAPPRTAARHADLCSRGRRLRFTRSSEAALAQPSSRRLSFSARRRRRSGEGSAPDPPRPRRGRAPGGRGGAARAPTERARAAGNAGSSGSRLTLRTPSCARLGQLPPVPVSAARAPAAAAARAARTSCRAQDGQVGPRGCSRTGSRGRLQHGRCSPLRPEDKVWKRLAPRSNTQSTRAVSLGVVADKWRGCKCEVTPQPWDPRGWSQYSHTLSCRKCWVGLFRC